MCMHTHMYICIYVYIYLYSRIKKKERERERERKGVTADGPGSHSANLCTPRLMLVMPALCRPGRRRTQMLHRTLSGSLRSSASYLQLCTAQDCTKFRSGLESGHRIFSALHALEQHLSNSIAR